MERLLEALKPHVTAFSAQLPLQFKHEDKVTVGGKVVSIFDPNTIDAELAKPYVGEPAPVESDMGVYITIDDRLGEITLVVFHHMYLAILEKLKEPLIGKVIIAEGQYGVLQKSTGFISEAGYIVNSDKHPNQESKPRVYCYEVKLIDIEI